MPLHTFLHSRKLLSSLTICRIVPDRVNRYLFPVSRGVNYQIGSSIVTGPRKW